MEIWKDVTGFEGLYQVSSQGRIKGIRTNYKEKILKPWKNKKGYLRIVLHKREKLNRVSIHRLVLKAFIPNSENKPATNHKDCCKTNNDVNNLEWVTYRENMLHAALNDLIVGYKQKPLYGINNYMAREVIQFDINGKRLKTFSYMAKAAKISGADPSAITKVCRGYRQTAGGYRWIYGDFIY